MEEKKKGQFTIRQRKKKKEITEESHHQVNIPPDIGDEEKKALEQTGDDANSSLFLKRSLFGFRKNP